MNTPDVTPRPAVLADCAPTRFRRRLTPLSRTPAAASLGDVWHTAADRAPDQLVIVDRPADIDPGGPTHRGYRGWAELVEQAGGWLHALGVRPWDRVAILKTNHLDVALLACAAARLGAVPAQLAGTYGPEVASVLLARLDRPFLITDAAHIERCGIDPETVARLTARTVTVDGPARPDLVHIDDLRGAPAPAPRPRRPDEPMVITHTSGTTGVPKLVAHSAGSAYSLALVEAERWPLFRLRTDDVVALGDPFCHQRLSTGMLAMATVTPRMLMLSDPASPAVPGLLAEHRPTVVETLPNAYLHWEPLARSPERPFRRTRLYINSFDAIHTRTIRTFLDATDRRLPIWVQSWSQSEAGAMVIRPYTRRSVRHRGRRPPPTQVLGWPIPGLCRARTVDPRTGRPLPRGQVGLVEIAQPGRSLGYVGEQDRHDRKRTGWWWNTGDLGVVSRLGAVRLIDREIDRIPGGSAIELEDVLLDRLPETTEVVVLPVAGALPVPVLSTAGDRRVTAERWRAATADLPPLADPIHVGWDELPRTITWKIRRVALREQLLAGTHAVGLGRWT
jgi:acyl-coenzyme A synthetase/AMP-(fatty) acid ligase